MPAPNSVVSLANKLVGKLTNVWTADIELTVLGLPENENYKAGKFFHKTENLVQRVLDYKEKHLTETPPFRHS